MEPMNLETSFAAVLDVLLKSTALLLAGAVLLIALRKASAANRHAVSVAIFAALLLLPLTKLIAPRWSLAMEPDPVVTTRVEVTPAGPIEMSPLPASAPSPEMDAPPVVSAPWVIPWKTLFVATWLVGAAVLMGRRLRISLQLRALARSSSPIRDEKLAALTRELVETSGICAMVRESALCRVPLVAGVVRPMVLLPENTHEWSESRIAFALCHELGHIRRRDCLTRLLAEITCALYWLNPLVWLAARQMRLAQEQACDDLVLNAGAPADEYAGQLVDAVRSLQADHLGTRHALAMAQPSTLETRVVAIMEPTRNRGPLSARGAFGWGTLVVVMLSVCAAAQLRGAQKPAGIAPGSEESKAGVAKAAQVEIEAWLLEISKEPTGLGDLKKAIEKANGPVILPPEEELREKGVTILANPRVITNSSQKAKIEIGRKFRYPTDWEKDATTGAWKSKSVATENIGISLEVTPAVTAEGTIDLDLISDVNDLFDIVDLDAPRPGAKRDPARVVPEGHRSQPVFKHYPRQESETVSPGSSVFHGVSQVFGSLAQAALYDLRKDLPQDPSKPDAEKQSRGHFMFLVTARVVARGGVPEKAGSAKADWSYPKIEFREASLREAADFLVKKSPEFDPSGKGTNILIKGESEFADARITLKLENAPVDEVLKHVAALANAEVVKEEFSFVLQPKAVAGGGAAPVAPNVEPKPALAAVANAKSAAWKRAGTIILPRLEFRGTRFAESIDFLRARAKQLDPAKEGVSLILQPAVGGEQPTITLSLSNIPLTEALRYVAYLANYEIVASDAAIQFKPITK
jgi:beta-lactamase regulating signal transducer with metallopeptidase domain